MSPSVVITGASGGIGFAAVQLFVEKGWTVLATDLETPDQDFPEGVQFLQADLAKVDQIEGLAAKMNEASGGSLDALVNNAALQITAQLAETSSTDFDRVIAVNLRAPLLLAQGLLPALETAGGAIVNVASVHSLATSPELGAYAASKGGLLSLTRTMAIEFVERGVRANAVLPGAIDTAMLHAGFERDNVAGEDSLAEKILMKRFGLPGEVAQSIYFLADKEQSSYITGQSLVVDGGALARLSIE